MKYLYLDILETNQTNTGFSSIGLFTRIYILNRTFMIHHQQNFHNFIPPRTVFGRHWLISNQTYNVFYPQCSDRQWELGTLVMFC